MELSDWFKGFEDGISRQSIYLSMTTITFFWQYLPLHLKKL